MPAAGAAPEALGPALLPEDIPLQVPPLLLLQPRLAGEGQGVVAGVVVLVVGVLVLVLVVLVLVLVLVLVVEEVFALLVQVGVAGAVGRPARARGVAVFAGESSAAVFIGRPTLRGKVAIGCPALGRKVAIGRSALGRRVAIGRPALRRRFAIDRPALRRRFAIDRPTWLFSICVSFLAAC